MLSFSQLGFILIGIALPHVLRLLLRLCLRQSVYEDDRDVLALNTIAPPTRWFNLGWWEEGTTSFPEAAAELCRRVASRAEISKGSRVLEVGSGYGEGARLLQSEHPSLASYFAVTAVRAHHAYAVRATRRLEQSAEFVHGDALVETNRFPAGSFDAVLAIDCAYHFDRDAWLRSAHRALGDGGRLALTDLLLPNRPLELVEHLALRFVCYMAGLPFRNLVREAEYRSTLESQGWRDIQLDDISSSVYPGFLHFMEQQGREVGHALSAWSGLATYASVVRWYSGAERPRLRFYLISAKR
ncbi:S-adenosyl-L-methionine-dependent methyltransferase [Leucosporidium creatinivorum]|uniref:phosphoethanolamine N-methyltransferase n=1 Tax=Leucosporidium creatinivorum TaxID=106004 RepID=A0A1Y2G3B1_9BASI|nr:S-adenosyl-L-methionine-dependent methyltransferase [Leucosporidium creatinivorum]